MPSGLPNCFSAPARRRRLAKRLAKPFPTPPHVSEPNSRTPLANGTPPQAGQLLGSLAKRSTDEPDLQTAIASSASGHSVGILNELFSDGGVGSHGQLTGNLLALAGAEASAAEIKKLLLNLTAKVDKLETWRLTALSALVENAQKRDLPRTELGLDDELLDSLNLICLLYTSDAADE